MAQAGVRRFLHTSIVIAHAGCFGPLVLRSIRNTASLPLAIVLSLSVVWIVYVLYAFRRYGKPELWTLLGLALALFWPFWIVTLVASCNRGLGCPLN